MNVGLKAKCLAGFIFRNDITTGKEYDVKGIIKDRITIENDLGLIGSYPINWFSVDIKAIEEIKGMGDKGSVGDKPPTEEHEVIKAIKGEKGIKGPKGPQGIWEGDYNKIRPDYYNDTKVTALEFIKANKLDFCEGNVIKYVTRHRKKNGREDLIKARTYIEELLKEYEED